MQRVASEGANDLMDYMSIPVDKRSIICPDTQYANLRYLVLELDLTITNTSKVLKDEVDNYRKILDKIIQVIDRRDLFLREVKRNGQLIQLNITSFFYDTRKIVFKLCRNLIDDISPLLYLDDKVKKKEW